MQSVSSRIWTRVAVSISNDDNDYNTGTSKAKLNGRKYFYVSLTIQLGICHLFTHILIIKQFFF